MSNTGKNSAKSAMSGNRKAGSPAGKASAASASAVTEPKKQKLTLWPEWNELDINSEKWEGVGKGAKDAKAKPASAPASQGFEDTDPKFEWPFSIQSRIDSFRRPSELYEKMPVVVDSDNGVENFDLITPNEHLHHSETVRWIISQIHTLWDICKKEIKPSHLTSASPSQALESSEPISNKALGAGRLWRPWEHIYAVNKVVKGPFIPVYNPYGKYVVRLYFMGTWRKIIIDDLMPVDDKGVLLLPVTTINGEIWPLLLTKALLKIISLDFNPADSATEFNDVSIITCFTGWLPEPLPLRFGHISEVWKFLKETLPKFQWNDEKPKISLEADDQILITDSNEIKEDLSTEKDNKTDKSGQKGGAAAAAKQKVDPGKASGKDTKMDKHKKDPKDKKGKSTVDEQQLEENFAPEFPEMVVFASFTDLPLNKLSASTEVADRRERLRKYNLNHDFSNPCWITCTRDIPLNPPPPPEIIPVWKTIRQRKKHVIPSDEPIHAQPVKQDQFIELKSPYVGYKSQPAIPIIHTTRTGSRFSKMRSRPQTAITGIEEMDEKNLPLENLKSDSPTELNKINLDLDKDEFNNSIKPPASSKGGGGSKAPESVKSSSFVNKKEREKSLDGTATSVKQGIGSANKLDDGTNSVKTSKSNEKHGLIEGAANQSITGLALDQGDKSFFQEPEPKTVDKTKLWMDFDDFFICFKSIVVYHKPSSFKYCEKYSDLRQVLPQQKVDKKKETNTALLQTGPLLDEKSPKLCFVDSLTPIELIVSFASLSRWYEQKLELPEKIVKSSKNKNESLVADHDTMSVAETIKEITPLQSGYLMAEPYSWKSLVTGQPLLRIHTTAIRSSFLSLPPGRHVLRFIIQGPVGCHINIISNTKFAFGDEEEIMPKLTDESCRFVDQALHIVKCLSDATKSFIETDKQAQAIELLYSSISPMTDAYLQKNDRSGELISRRSLLDTFQNSLYEMLRKALGEQVDPEMAFAWRVFLFDFITPDILSLKERRPETSSTNRGSAKKIDKEKEKDKDKDKTKKGEQPQGKNVDKGDKQSASIVQANEKSEKDSNDEKMEFWKNHQPSAGEHIASVKLQAAWRGFYTRKIINSREPGSEKNLQVFEQLKKALNIISATEQSLHENALFLFRTMFKINPPIMQYYSFYKDEWNRITYSDYNGSYLDQVSNSWFILFRDVFYASEEVLLLPKLYCNLNNCLLKVINNDTYTEIPKVFNKVSPYTYTKNKRGYTIIAESRIQDQPVSPGRWRFRLIGSSSSLIAPLNNKPEIVSAFDARDTRDYYMPNEKKLILRYKVNVTSDDHLLSMQITTSKPDVYIKFSIFDGEKEILSVNGKGTAVIPAFIFLKDRSESNGDGTSRPNSKTFSSGRTSKNVEAKETKSSGKRKSSLTNHEIPKAHNSRSSSRASNAADPEEDEQNLNHEYYIEARVLKDSWPLSPSQWAFINTLKENEAAELKVFSKDRALSPSKESKANSSESKGAALKAAKAKAQKKGTPAPPTTSRPASSAFDSNKPHWILKWVSDATCADAIEIKRDTDRIDKIKALKRAWESHEAGRAAKATIARAEFLKTHLVRVDGISATTDDEGEKTADDEAQNAQAPPTTIDKQSSQTSIKVSDTKVSKTSKPSGDDSKAAAPASKGAKVKDSKKDKADSNKPSQELVTQMSDHQVNDSITIPDEPLSNRPPTPPKPKVYLPPLDVAPFIRTSNMGEIIKDEEFEKEQTHMRKMEMENFLKFKEQISKFREDERKYRLQQKLKQIEECENLQYKLDQSRKDIYEPREAFRQLFLDAERKRLEEMAGQEAILATTQKADSKEKNKKGSAGKGKKK